MDGVLGLTTADIGVVFQPIVDITSGRAFAHEALVRCKKREYASPPVLFDFAVKEDACGKLGRLIREVAFDTSGDIPLFVNLHPAELTARWLIQPDDPIGYHAKEVFLEITETATFTHFDLCRSVLKEVCERTGALLVIDDFGAGHSNLERVVHLEPAVVKLDLGLTRQIQEYPRKQIVVRHMVSLCRELGARVVAEGVETLDELKCVRDLGVDFAQGYLLARPGAPPPDHTWPFTKTTVRAPVAASSRAKGPPPSKRPPIRQSQSRRPAK